MQIKRHIAFPLVLASALIAQAGAQNLNLTISDSNPSTPPNVALSPCAIPLTAATVTFEPDGDINASVAVESMDDCLEGSIAAGAPIVDLNLSATDIDSGDDVTVSWSIQNYIGGLTACTPSGGTTTTWSSVSINAATGSAGPYNPTTGSNFTLTCTNGSDSDQVALVVNGTGGGSNDPDPSLQCDTLHPPPSGTTRESPVGWFTPQGASGSATTYQDLFGTWPGNVTNTRILQIPAGEYVSLPFTTDTSSTFSFSWVGSAGNQANSTYVTIHRCPGEFDYTNLETTCLAASGSEGGASIRGAVGTVSNHCKLDPNTLYFLNIIHATAVNPGPSVTACPTSSCNLTGSVN